ncbi:histidinol phosphatase-like enzyme (inositol monophosphatase family) [Mesorhizobium sp. J18]|uniref:histidinol-phosphatase n=1 Tax=Mesorhizobium sp. J18 TaxID=935263 RepID=UPI00119A303F|nr:histidinol-phosphatase [Mesorhizobium sp. J18]TWH00172.1 histidinol phosphatase-like enzyme (inositol monophosphatase family) [Mesorhizobium sp. J18]
MTVSAAFLRRLAERAGQETLPRFRMPAAVDNKLVSGFDPVTEADRAAEKAIRALIAEEFPGHGLLGEEFGPERIDSSHVWVIDPIDGTRAFISGLPLWGTLVGLTVDGDAVAGMMSQPFTGEFFYANEEGAHYEGPGGPRRLAARRTTGLSEATLCTTTPALFDGARRALYDRVEAAVRLPRYGTDCYAYAMVAAGQVDLVIECGLQSYDIVALIPIIERAGGVITTWDGGPAEKGGDIIAAATPELHQAALDYLRL